MQPRLIRLGRTIGEGIEAMMPLVWLVALWMIGRGALWIVGGMNG